MKAAVIAALLALLVWAGWPPAPPPPAPVGMQAAKPEPPPGVGAGLWEAFQVEQERAGATPEETRWYAAQVKQESDWRPCPTSPAGAKGPTQFMAATWRPVSRRVEPSCEGKSRCDAPCAFRGQVDLMRENLARRQTFMPSERWPAALSDYNGGPVAMSSERAKCVRAPWCNPNRWFGHVEKMRARGEAAYRENRQYPIRIMEHRRLYADLETEPAG